jgi:type II secretory pathway predicted ATPase ExeA
MTDNNIHSYITVPEDIINTQNKFNTKPLEETIKKPSRKKPVLTHSNEVLGPIPTKAEDILTPTEKLSPPDWFTKKGWQENPFTMKISPDLFVGYKNESQSLVSAVQSGHKVILIVGPTGSGKTTLLRWAETTIPAETMLINKMPETIEDFVEIFNDKFRPPWFLRWFMSHIKNVYQIPEFLNKKLKDKKMVIFCDEIHEAKQDVLEWLRVIVDQVDNLSIVLSGLPVFEEQLKRNLETLRKRISTRIELISLTKEETIQLIKKRIENVGGSIENTFMPDVLDYIYTKTGGFPREVIRFCDEAVMEAIKRGVFTIDGGMFLQEPETEEKVSLSMVDDITPLQREILESLAVEPKSPAEIVESIHANNYKSKQHAVRSINNILKRMQEEGMLERDKRGRTFAYILAPQIKTMLIKT